MRAAEVGVLVLGPEGRDLEHVVVAPHRDGAEPVLVDGAREQRDDPLRQRVGRQVPVLRLAAKQRIAQRSAHDEGGVPVRVQVLEELGDGLRYGDGESRGGGLGIGHGGRQLRPRKM